MNDPDHDPETDVFDRRLHWAVDEMRGREAPDVTDAVMARIDAVPAHAHRKNVWLAAALVLFGIGAVFAVSWTRQDESRHEAQGGEQERQRLQDMPFVIVRTRAELDALPQDTRGVELVGMGFAEVDALRERCPYVRKLRLRGDAVEGGTIFRALWLRHLRHLDIDGCANATPNIVAELANDPELLQVRFGGQAWLTFEHLELLARSGIEPIVAPSHPLVLSVAQLVCDHGEKMRQRQLADLQPIPFQVVRSIADIAALPRDTVAVDGLDLEDQAIGALARLTALRHLRLRSGVQTVVVPLLDLDASYSPHTSDANRRSVTDAGLAQLVPLANLESLELAGTIEVRGPGLEHLARLPRLGRLSLICIDTSDEGLAHLPAFPALRELRLERNHGFGARGMEHIGRCSRLTSFTIVACPQLDGAAYRSLRDLTSLRELRIRAGHDTWRNDSQRTLRPDEQELLARMRPATKLEGSALTDPIIADLLAPLSALTALQLGSTAGTDAGFAKLAALTSLRSLDLTANPGLTPAPLLLLSPELRELDLTNCENIDDSIGAVVRARFPHLEALHLSMNQKLTDLADIVAIDTLRTLTIRGCEQLGASAAEQLRAANHLRTLDYTMCPKLPADLADHLRARGVAVKQRFW